MRRLTAITVVPVQRTTSTDSSTGPSTIIEFVHFSMLTALCTHKHNVKSNTVQCIRQLSHVNWQILSQATWKKAKTYDWKVYGEISDDTECLPDSKSSWTVVELTWIIIDKTYSFALPIPIAEWCGVSWHTLCPQKTCDYIFYNNFNNKCPITIIFGLVRSKSMCHRKMFHFPPHLSSATTLPWEITEHKKWPISP